MQRRKVTRTEARGVRCPACEAPIGQPCMGKRAVRESVHLERMHAAYDARTLRERLLGKR